MCLRLLIDEDIPLNQGVLAPVAIGAARVPAQSAAKRRRRPRCPAVVGGNVETSQRVVDVLLGALGLAAASQGTMNNLLFGDATFGYYETICGGAGATADGRRRRRRAHAHDQHAADRSRGIANAATRSACASFPSAAARAGGACTSDSMATEWAAWRRRHRAATGVLARAGSLDPLAAPRALSALRRGRRRARCPGRNTLMRVDGKNHCRPGAILARPGDVLTIETPGGGGWGAADQCGLPTPIGVET